MAVSNDDVMRRRFALADMGQFPTSPNRKVPPRRGSDPLPEQPPTQTGPKYGLGEMAGDAFARVVGHSASANSPVGQATSGRMLRAGVGALGSAVSTLPMITPKGQPPAPAPVDGLVHNPNDPARYANLNANPAPGGGFGDLREREAMRGADRPEPVATGSAAPATTGDLSQRVGDERRALMSDYERVMRELVDMGSRGRDTNPEMQTRREVLINARKAMESRLRDLAMATPRTNVVSPEDAKVARERLARTSGVDTRTPMERGITSIANRTMPGAGSVLGEATAMSADKMAFNERQMARDARQAEGARRLTTALPGGEAPLAMMERERAEMQKRRADQVALEQATAERAIRDQTEGTPDEVLKRAQAGEATARAKYASDMTDIERQRMMREYDNPGSITNLNRRAGEAGAGRSAAYEISGYNPEQAHSQAASLAAGFGRYMQTDGALNRGKADAGLIPNTADAMRDIGTYESVVLGPLEVLAQNSPAEAAKEAAVLLQGLPPTKSDGMYGVAGFINRLHPSVTGYVDAMNRLRQRLQQIASANPRPA